MRRLASVVAVAAAAALCSSAYADAPTLDLSPLHRAQCGGGRLVVNVQLSILNDADSGVAGNVWAFDTIERHLRVWQTGSNTYCAIVRDEGGFATNDGTSPGGTDTVAAGIQGDFEGGYRTTRFTGTFAPTVPTRGDLGTFDYACDTSFNCPGSVSWRSLYFSSISGFDLDWWGWTYTTEANGTWVNAISGNLGDITGSPPSDEQGD